MIPTVSAMYEAFRQGAFADAARIAERLLHDSPASFDAAYVLASIKSLPMPELNDYPGAKQLMADAVQASPSNERCWIALAEVQTAAGDYEQAAATYRETLRRWSSCYDALLGLALLAGHPGLSCSAEQSRELLERAASIDPGRGDAFYYLGLEMKAAGRIADARRLLQSAVSLLKSRNAKLHGAAEAALRSL